MQSRLIFPHHPGFREWEKLAKLSQRRLSLSEFSQRWDINQSQLADMLGVTRRTMNRWINSEVSPGSAKLVESYLYRVDSIWNQ